MEDLTIYTPTELLKFVNDTKDKHEAKKKEILNILVEFEKWGKLYDDNLAELKELETKYVLLIEELNKR